MFSRFYMWVLKTLRFSTHHSFMCWTLKPGLGWCDFCVGVFCLLVGFGGLFLCVFQGFLLLLCFFSFSWVFFWWMVNFSADQFTFLMCIYLAKWFYYLPISERPLPSDDSLQKPPASKRPRTEDMALSTSTEDQIVCNSNKD